MEGGVNKGPGDLPLWKFCDHNTAVAALAWDPHIERTGIRRVQLGTSLLVHRTFAFFYLISLCQSTIPSF